MMIEVNPYESPQATQYTVPSERKWTDGAESSLLERGLLRRKVVVNRPVEVTIEYFARGLRDQIFVDGKRVVSVVPIFWFRNRFEFEIPYCDGFLPAVVNVKIGHRLRVMNFEIEIGGVVVYQEKPITIVI